MARTLGIYPWIKEIGCGSSMRASAGDASGVCSVSRVYQELDYVHFFMLMTAYDEIKDLTG